MKKQPKANLTFVMHFQSKICALSFCDPCDILGPVKTRTKRLPKAFDSYFWDVDPKKIDIVENSRYVIERLMELGDPRAMKWLIKQYTRKNLVLVLSTTRRLSKKSASFWALLLKVPLKEIKCLNEEFQKTQSPVWDY